MSPSWLPVLVAILTLATGARAESVANFFHTHPVTLIAGFPPGGGYDANVRLLARRFGAFIPGHPTVIAANMPGAGSLTAANYLYNSAPADGTVMAMFASSSAVEPYLNNPAANFDPLKFSWLGSMSSDVAYCGLWQGPGVPSSFAETLQHEVLIGGGVPAAITYQHPTIIRNVLGAKFKVINGYAGTRDISLAMSRGEVNGTCGLYTSSIKSQWSQELASGQLKLIIQMGPKKLTTFGDIPSVYDFVTSEEQRAILDVHFQQMLLARPLAAPPGTPPERLEALKGAFAATLADPEFLQMAATAGIDIDLVTTDQIRKLLGGLASLSPQIRQKALEVMGR